MTRKKRVFKGPKGERSLKPGGGGGGKRAFPMNRAAACARKTITLLFLLSLAVMPGLFVLWAQEAYDKGPDVITLKDYDMGSGPVTFTHIDHGNTGEVGATCWDCHHKVVKGTTPGKCSECHKSNESDDGTPSYIHAFHRQCIGCHTEEIKQGNSEVLITCDSCHIPDK